MPKPKPDEVIRHEIVLGRAEREIIRDLKVAYTFNRVLSPFTNISAGGAILAGASSLIIIDYILDSLGLDPNWREITEDMTPEQKHDWLEDQNLVVGGIAAIIAGVLALGAGASFGGIAVAAAAGGVAGGVAVETAEDLAAGAQERIEHATEEREKFFNNFWGGLLVVRGTLAAAANLAENELRNPAA